jgi:hypothetical protein
LAAALSMGNMSCWYSSGAGCSPKMNRTDRQPIKPAGGQGVPDLTVLALRSNPRTAAAPAPVRHQR